MCVRVVAYSYTWAHTQVSAVFPASVSWQGNFKGEYHDHTHQILVTVVGVNFGPLYRVLPAPEGNAHVFPCMHNGSWEG